MHSIAQTIQTALGRYGNAVAFQDADSVYTFRDIADITDRVVSLYRQCGLHHGDRVVMLQRNSIDFIVTELAIYRAGLARVAVNVRLSPTEYTYILRDSDANACIYDPEFQTDIDRIKTEVPCAIWLRSDELIKNARNLPPAHENPAAVSADGEAIIQYTSGTTGRPKGAVITQASKVQIDRNTLIELDLGTDDVMLHVTPLTHASGALMLPCLLRGVRQVVMEFADAPTTIEWITTYQATACFMVPTIIKMITDHPDGASLSQLASLKTVIYAGSPISTENLASALTVFGERLLQFYGLSEAQFPVATLRKQDHRPDSHRLGSAGRPVPHVELQIRGEDNQPLPVGQIGEITTRGPHVMDKYWNNDQATAKVLDPDGWFRTGDVGYLDEDGYLYLVDRKNDMIISGGFNVYPLEVEHALCRHPQIIDAAVFGIPDARWGEGVAAAIVLAKGAAVTNQQVEDHCRTLVAGFKLPRTFLFVDALPRNSAGKLLRRELRNPFWEGSDRPIRG